MNGFIISMIMIGVIFVMIGVVFIAELIADIMIDVENEKKLRENRERVWTNFVRMGK